MSLNISLFDTFIFTKIIDNVDFPLILTLYQNSRNKFTNIYRDRFDYE